MNLSTLSQKIKQLAQLVHQLGSINASLYLANRMTALLSIKLFFNKYYLVAQSLNTQPLLPKNKGQLLRIVELLPDQLDSHPCPRPRAVLADRYRQGAVCIAAYKGEEFAGCIWYVKPRYQEDEVRCLYDLQSEHAVWDFDVYVVPKFRLSPVFLKLWDEVSAKLLAENCYWSLSRISAFNAMSLSSHKRLGAKVLGWAVFTQLGSIQLTIATVRPYLHVSFSENSFPTFNLQPSKS